MDLGRFIMWTLVLWNCTWSSKVMAGIRYDMGDGTCSPLIRTGFTTSAAVALPIPQPTPRAITSPPESKSTPTLASFDTQAGGFYSEFNGAQIWNRNGEKLEVLVDEVVSKIPSLKNQRERFLGKIQELRTIALKEFTETMWRQYQTSIPDYVSHDRAIETTFTLFKGEESSWKRTAIRIEFVLQGELRGGVERPIVKQTLYLDYSKFERPDAISPDWILLRRQIPARRQSPVEDSYRPSRNP
mgnify:CR=1 FL=1